MTIPGVVLADQLSKWLAWNMWGPAGHLVESHYLGGLVRFHFARNTGSAFGLFQGQSGLLTMAGIVAVSLLVVFFVRHVRRNPLAAAALGLLIGGAIGNLIDRIRLGYVIDWIKLPVTLSFNIADFAITLGVVLMLLATMVQESRQREDSTVPEGAEATEDALPLASGHED